MNCSICSNAPLSIVCDSCLQVRELVLTSEPDSLILIVDGSWRKAKRGNQAGAGLVLATAADEIVVAVCAASFYAPSCTDAEYQAIVRGLRWAPVGIAWSDSTTAIQDACVEGLDARFLPLRLRDPLHNLAHRLAACGRNKDWDRFDRIWVPGAVW